MKLRNQYINDALAEVKKARRELDKTVIKYQCACSHEHKAECNSTSPPVRMCLSCGLSEDGWGSGFHVLKHSDTDLSLPILSYDAWLGSRVGLYIKDHHKGPLIRKEITLHQLIKNGGSLNEKPSDQD